MFVSGIGCELAVPVLHEHLRYPQHPRPGPGRGHRDRRRPPRSRRVGDHRRRRRPVDRREPPHPRPAPEREPHDPAVQQPDLRAHQGSVLAHLRGGQGHQVDALRLGGHPVQPHQPGPRGGGDLRGPHPRPRPQAHDGDDPAGPRAPRAPRSWRSTRTATSSTTGPSTPSQQRDAARQPHPARPRPAHPVRRRPAARGGRSTETADSGSPTWPRSARTPSSSTTRPETRGLAFQLTRLAPGPYEPTPIGVFRAVERDEYGDGHVPQLLEAHERHGARATSALLASGGPGPSATEPRRRESPAIVPSATSGFRPPGGNHARAWLRMEERALRRHPACGRGPTSPICATVTGRIRTAASAVRR